MPVGLIDNAWGGSAARHGFPRDRLNQLAVAKPYMDQWEKTEQSFDFAKLQKAYDEKLKVWQAKAVAARKAGKPAPAGRSKTSPQSNDRTASPCKLIQWSSESNHRLWY